MPVMEAIICPICHGIGTGCKRCRGKGWLPLMGEKCPICGKKRSKPGKPICQHIHFAE